HVIEVTKPSALAHYQLAMAQGKAGNTHEVLAHVSKAAELDPNNAVIHYKYALTLAKVDPDRAIEEFLLTAKLDPGFPEPHRHLAQLYGEQGKQAEATSELQEILRIDPEDVQAHVRLGLTYMKQWDMDEARRHFEEAVRLNPQNSEAHNYLGLTHA